MVKLIHGEKSGRNFHIDDLKSKACNQGTPIKIEIGKGFPASGSPNVFFHLIDAKPCLNFTGVIGPVEDIAHIFGNRDAPFKQTLVQKGNGLADFSLQRIRLRFCIPEAPRNKGAAQDI